MKSIYYTCLIILLTITNNTLINYRSSLDSNRVCSSGKNQSPINLIEGQSAYNPSIAFLSDDYQVITQNLTLDGFIGYVYTITAPAGSNFGSIYLTKDGYLTKNILTQITINFPSEHTIAGVPGDLEVKLIHQRVLDYKSDVNTNRQLTNVNPFFSISVLFKRGASYPSDQGFLNNLFPGWQSMVNSPYFQNVYNINLDINKYGLMRGKKFYYYEGSHTYIPCDEDMSTIVISEFVNMPDNFYTFIYNQMNIRYLNGNGNKNIAAISGRPIYRNYITDSESAALNSSSYGLRYCICIIGMILLALL